MFIGVGRDDTFIQFQKELEGIHFWTLGRTKKLQDLQDRAIEELGKRLKTPSDSSYISEESKGFEKKFFSKINIQSSEHLTIEKVKTSVSQLESNLVSEENDWDCFISQFDNEPDRERRVQAIRDKYPTGPRSRGELEDQAKIISREALIALSQSKNYLSAREEVKKIFQAIEEFRKRMDETLIYDKGVQHVINASEKRMKKLQDVQYRSPHLTENQMATIKKMAVAFVVMIAIYYASGAMQKCSMGQACLNLYAKAYPLFFLAPLGMLIQKFYKQLGAVPS